MTDERPTDDEEWTRALDMMNQVYEGMDYRADGATPYTEHTVRHVFGEVWPSSTLSIRDRRLVNLGICAALGENRIMESQIRNALGKGELGVDDLRSLVVHLAYYVGWPRTSTVNKIAEQAISEYEKR